MKRFGETLLAGLRRVPAVNTESSTLRGLRLRESDLFRDLDDQEMAEIAERLTMATCPAGRLIYEPDQTGEALFILKSGTVRLYRMTPDGRKLVLAILTPGTVFGEMTALAQTMTGTFAEAHEDCMVCILSQRDIEEILMAHPDVALRLVRLFAERVREAEERLEQIAFKSVPARVAKLLLQLADERGEVGDHSHHELAEMVGTSRETVSRVLMDLKREGHVEIDRRSVRILNRDSLGELAESDWHSTARDSRDTNQSPSV